MTDTKVNARVAALIQRCDVIREELGCP